MAMKVSSLVIVVMVLAAVVSASLAAPDGRSMWIGTLLL